MRKFGLHDNLTDKEKRLIRTLRRQVLSWAKSQDVFYYWRKKPTAYSILMAELLLQRTRAQQAEKQFIIYMKKYPTFSKLQKAKKSGLSKIFRPLGLEKRVNTVTTLVKVINKNYNGDIPKKYEDLMKLPGVGDYIANAVMIFALNRPGWLVDVNIIKVFSDLFGLNISREEGKKSKFIKECSKYFTSLGNPRKSNWNLLDYAMKNGG